MTNSPKGSLYSVLFGIAIALASVLVVSATSLQTVTSSISNDLYSEDADIDDAEDVAASKATMAGATDHTTTNGNMTEVEFLSIQTAQSGSLSQTNETAYILELKNISDSTVMFSDRPERIVETVSTLDFVGNWSAGQNSFSSDTPNDALIVEDSQTGQLDAAIIESFAPVYDTNTNTLTYTIIAENATSIGLPGEFGESVLVIDTKVWGYEGVVF